MVTAGLCGHCKNLAILPGIRRYDPHLQLEARLGARLQQLRSLVERAGGLEYDWREVGGCSCS